MKLFRLGRARAAEVSAAELAEALQRGAAPVVVDIRGDQPFAAGHLPGAIHIPLDRLHVEAARLNRFAPTVVY